MNLVFDGLEVDWHHREQTVHTQETNLLCSGPALIQEAAQVRQSPGTLRGCREQPKEACKHAPGVSYLLKDQVVLVQKVGKAF